MLLASPQSADLRRNAPDLGGRPRSRGDRLVVGAALAAKVLLGGCLLHALAFPGLVQYRDKAMGYRLVAYPALLALVPLAVLLWRRRHGRGVPAEKYPWLVDLCATLPFLLDSLGNAANLYDTVSWWDDAMHVVTWAPLVVAFGLVVRRRVVDPVLLAGLCLGFGAVTHICWEVGEYLTFVQTNTTESASAYRDTIGDLVMSLLGSIVGATIVGLTAPETATTGPAVVPAGTGGVS